MKFYQRKSVKRSRPEQCHAERSEASPISIEPDPLPSDAKRSEA